MSNIIESIIFIVLGGVANATAMTTQVGWEIIGLCAAITVAAIACLVVSLIKRK